jgi:organic hydroperoxide reductase OsmC/OhrA
MSNKFNVGLTWLSQNKNFTYNEYSREYTIHAEGKPELIGTAAPEYKGSHEHYNPEDMLIASLSACHMLSYLALAANSKIQVLSYQDQAEGSLIKDGMSMKFNEVILKPHVVISQDSDQEKALSLHDKAHHICFIANSVNFSVLIQPQIAIA